MKFLILLLTMSSLNGFLLAGDFFSGFEKTSYYKQIDKAYDEPEISQKKGCNTCGIPAILLPYNGEDIPMAKTFPCSAIKGCMHTVLL